MRFKQDLMKKLNLNILDLTNQTVTEGLLDLPVLYCDIHEYPDYIALYSQPSDYHKTMNTAVSFYDMITNLMVLRGYIKQFIITM